MFQSSVSILKYHHALRYLHHRCAIVCDGLLAVLINQQKVPAVGAQGSFDRGLDSETSVDIGNDLALALRLVGA